jgi:hypothetical protein
LFRELLQPIDDSVNTRNVEPFYGISHRVTVRDTRRCVGIEDGWGMCSCGDSYSSFYRFTSGRSAV